MYDKRAKTVMRVLFFKNHALFTKAIFECFNNKKITYTHITGLIYSK